MKTIGEEFVNTCKLKTLYHISESIMSVENMIDERNPRLKEYQDALDKLVKFKEYIEAYKPE